MGKISNVKNLKHIWNIMKKTNVIGGDWMKIQVVFYKKIGEDKKNRVLEREYQLC